MISRRADHSFGFLLRRTVAAQIHALALILVGIGMAVLLPRSLAVSSADFWACLVFLVTGALLFSTSSLYHFLYDGFHMHSRLELFFENLDHYCIYLFIAGTYTPVLINAVGEPWRTPLLVAVWVVALSGIVYTRVRPHLFPFLQSRWMYTTLFLLMGLIFIVRVGEIYLQLSVLQIYLLTGGSLSYVLGAVCYATRRPILAAGFFGYHELWHLTVLIGAALHFGFILTFY